MIELFTNRKRTSTTANAFAQLQNFIRSRAAKIIESEVIEFVIKIVFSGIFDFHLKFYVN